MPLTQESQDNFNRGVLGDRFFGVVDRGTGFIHLAIGDRGDGVAVPIARLSRIANAQRNTIPGAGGHAILAGWAGVQAQQVGAGVAQGNAYGFMIEITAAGLRLTLRSGFNGQYGGARPAGTRAADMLRTLPILLADNVEAELGALGRTITRNYGDI